MSAGGGFVDIDPALLTSSMWKSPFRLRHALDHNPLLSRDAIVRLAREHDPSLVEHGRSDQPVVFEKRVILPHATAASAAVDIEDGQAWVVVRFVDHLPAYAALLEAVSDAWSSVLSAHDGPARASTGTIFMTSPGGVAPAHFDRHHNILLQIEGTKEVSVGEFDDDVIRGQEFHRQFQGADHLLRLPSRFETFTIGPGEGVYIPPYRPHWVVCHQSVTIGLSCSVRTKASHGVELALTFDSKVRRLGLRPRMTGVPCRLDAAKAVAVTAWRARGFRANRPSAHDLSRADQAG